MQVYLRGLRNERLQKKKILSWNAFCSSIKLNVVKLKYFKEMN